MQNFPLSSGLQGSLSTRLTDVLVDMQNQQQRLLHCQLPRQQVDSLLALRAASSLLPAQSSIQQQTPALAPSLLLSSTLPTPLSPHLQDLGNAHSSLILTAALASQKQSRLLAKAKISLIQKQMLLENHRSRILATEAALSPPKLQQELPVAKKALEVLGRSLRKAADPYIDAAELCRNMPATTSNNTSTTNDNNQVVNDKQPRKARGGVTDPFPDKLHRMLSDHGDKYSDIVSFLAHGRAFLVHDMARFVSEVMPLYFKQTKWASFSRQLNLYGFRRIRSGPDAGAYYHELFLRGRPQLVEHMRRAGVPQGQQDRRKDRTGQSGKHTARLEPDLYAMKALE